MDGTKSGRRALEVLSPSECLALVGSVPVGRVAVADRRTSPMVHPVNHVVHGRSVVFRCSFGAMLSRLSAQPVSFEADAYDPIDQTGWSVLVRGVAREVRARDVHPHVPVPWVEDDRPYVFRLDPHQITGRRLGPR